MDHTSIRYGDPGCFSSGSLFPTFLCAKIRGDCMLVRNDAIRIEVA